jgi:DoxX-like protein
VVPDRTNQLVVGLAAFQVVDALAGLIPRRLVAAHLDHLGVPNALRPALPVIKVTTAAGLLVGRNVPRIGAATSAALVAYYAAAARFHLLSGDHPVLAAPAALCGAGAAVILLRSTA